MIRSFAERTYGYVHAVDGVQITPRILQDTTKSIFNLAPYIDGILFGIGAGIASPVSVSGGVDIK
jgi:hypothetical protein